MKCFSVEARDLPDAWFQCVDLCYQHGRDYAVKEGSYANAQKRRELDYITIHISHPQTRPLLPELPPDMLAAGVPNPVPEGMDYVEQYLPYLMTDAIKPGEQYTYGQRLFGRHWRDALPEEMAQPGQPETGQRPAIQVDEVIAKFMRSFENNQACMTIAKPSDITLPDPPCLRQIDCRIYPDDCCSTGFLDYNDTKRLHFCIYFRSWDLWGGFPANLAAIAHLQEYMAQEIGVQPGEMVCASKGLHLYDMYWELARRRLGG
jgi:thymidylate synthase